MSWETKRTILIQHQAALWAQVADYCDITPEFSQREFTDSPYEEAPLNIPGRAPDEQCERFCILFGVNHELQSIYHARRHRLHSLFILEPDAKTLATWLRHSDCAALMIDARVRWLCGDDMAHFTEELKERSVALGVFGAQLLQLPTSAERFPKTWRRIYGDARRLAAASWENRRTCNQNGVEMQLNLIHNTPYLRRGVDPQCVKTRWSGAPAVVIGAGPSLDRNITALRGASPGVLLIAADTALRSLQREGIDPHFVFSCDPSPLNQRHFEGIATLGRSVLTFLPEAFRGILAHYAEHNRILAMRDRESKLLERLSDLLPPPVSFQRGSNAGYCAFSLARWLGCRPIILAGLDLSVSRHGRSHVSGSAYASDVLISDNGQSMRLRGGIVSQPAEIVEVAGYAGGAVPTFPHFAQALRRIEEDIMRDGLEVIDATEGGAMKRGASQMTLQEALRRHSHSGDCWRDLDSLPWRPPTRITGDERRQINAIYRSLCEAGQVIPTAQANLRRWIHASQFASHHKNIRDQAQNYLNRWRDLLNSTALDASLDVALAPLRFDADRLEIQTAQNRNENLVEVGHNLLDGMERLQRLIEQAKTEWRALISRLDSA